MSLSHLQLAPESSDVPDRAAVEDTSDVPWGFLGLLAASALAHRAMSFAAAAVLGVRELTSAELCIESVENPQI